MRRPYEELRTEVIESGRPGSARIPFQLPTKQIMLEVHLQRAGDGIDGCIFDISQEDAEQQAIRTQMMVMNFAEGIARFGTWAYDIRADSFAASKGAVNLIMPGADPSEFTLDRVLELVHPEDRSALLAAHEKALKTGLVQQTEFRTLADHLWFSVQFMRILDFDGEPAYTCGMLHETTDLHEHEQIQADYAQMKALHDLRARFVNAAAHELNQPLTPMRLELAVLADLLPAGHQVAQAFEVVQRNIDRLEFMIRDLLDAAKLQVGRLEVDIEDVDLCDHVENVVKTMRPLARQRAVDLSWKPDGSLKARGDPMRVEQCLSNLIHNALKFTREATTVTITTRQREGFIEVRVHDKGLGLDDEQKKRLFEPFERIHASPKGFAGTGLGLYVTKMLAEAMGGRVDVESIPKKESTFSLVLQAT